MLLVVLAGDFRSRLRLQSDLPPQAAEAALAVLFAGMERFCTAIPCRHRAIVNYFGEDLPADNCSACDLCLGELEFVSDPLVTGQKILSCVAQLQQSYRAGRGGGSRRCSRRTHSRAGPRPAQHVRHSQGASSQRRSRLDRTARRTKVYLEKTGDYDVLQLTADGRNLLRGEASPRF